MILVRDVFQLHFGKTREAMTLLKSMGELERRMGYNPSRVLTDLTGEYYTLVMESEFENLAALEQTLNSFTDEWREVYRQFVPLVRHGRREVFRVVDMT